MPTYKLTYFDGRGRAELARLIFHAAGVKFEDVRVSFADWGPLKPGTPFGSLPVLEVDGKPLAQSATIARFLANEFGLVGSDNMEKAKIDEAFECVGDLIVDFYKTKYGIPEEEKAKATEEFFAKTFSGHMEKIEKILSRNKSGSGFLVGAKLSYADLFLLAVFDNFPDQPVDKNIKQHREKVAKLPNIAKYLNQRPVTTF